ncbi:MAG: 3'-5' exonuclease, partial [Deferrisomatales bacterium]
GLTARLADGPRVAVWAAEDERAEAAWVAREVETLVGGTSHAGLRAGRGGEGGYSFADVAVLHRLRAQGPALEEAFHRAGIPCGAVGGEPGWLRGRGRDLLRRLRGEPAEAPAGAPVRAALAGLGVPPDGALAAAWLAAAAAAGSVGALLERLALGAPDDDYDPRAERVTLLTLHAAKGLEFPVVFVVGCEDGLVPLRRDGEAPDLAEERRLLYVGMTRAKQALYLTRARRRLLYGQVRRQGPSPFLADLAAALVEARESSPAGRSSAGPRQLPLL